MGCQQSATMPEVPGEVSEEDAKAFVEEFYAGKQKSKTELKGKRSFIGLRTLDKPKLPPIGSNVITREPSTSQRKLPKIETLESKLSKESTGKYSTSTDQSLITILFPGSRKAILDKLLSDENKRKEESSDDDEDDIESSFKEIFPNSTPLKS